MAPGQPDFLTLLLEAAREEGFPLAGAVDIEKARSRLAEHVARYDRWLAEGRAGAMEYLVRGRDRRADPTIVMPGALSVLSVAIPYERAPGGPLDPRQGPRQARYIQGRDYHLEIAEKLERAMKRVQGRCERADELKWKVCVDTSAVLERAWAEMAGLGWIGKNTLLIHPKLGSYLFLAEVLINRQTGAGPSPLPDLCGHCTRCLGACPTSAIRPGRELETRECISYATLEKRGDYPEGARPRDARVAAWVAGCDICQEVCPFNLKPSRGAEASTRQFMRWRELLEETEEQYRARVRESSMSRVKPTEFSRNLAVALTQACAESSDDDYAWRSELEPLVARRIAAEKNERVLEEWRRCLEALKGGPATRT